MLSAARAEHKWPTNSRSLDTATKKESDYISRRPNSYFNRLASNQPITEPKMTQDTVSQHYETQARSPKSSDSSRRYNSKFGGAEDRLLLNHKRRRVTCIPIRQKSQNGKTFFDVNLLVADINLHGAPGGGGGYNAYGGYNCVPINSGGNPYQFINIDHGTIINRPIRPFGGGGNGGVNFDGILGSGGGGGGGGGGLLGIGQGLIGIFGHGVNYLNSYLDGVASSNEGSIAGSIASGGSDIVAASTSDGVSSGVDDYDEVDEIDEDPIRPIAEVGIDENYYQQPSVSICIFF